MSKSRAAPQGDALAVGDTSELTQETGLEAAEADRLAALDEWLLPIRLALRHKTRERICARYIEALLSLDGRKTVQALAAGLAGISYDQLHHFLTSAAWDSGPLEAGLIAKLFDQRKGRPEWLALSELILPKKGAHSVGVARQQVWGQERAVNCQRLLVLMLAEGGQGLGLGLRLCLPDSWGSDAARMGSVGVPEVAQKRLDRDAVALAQIDRALVLGASAQGILLDGALAPYTKLREGLEERGLHWAAQIAPDDLGLQAQLGPRVAADLRDLLAHGAWRGLGGAADTAIAVGSSQSHAGAMLWLVAERQANEATRILVSNAPPSLGTRGITRLVQARHAQAIGFERLLQDFGLGDYEGRSWAGLHRHGLLAMLAQLFAHTQRALAKA
jgi:SRSO17 transposase